MRAVANGAAQLKHRNPGILGDAKRQVKENDREIVIADNGEDSTAAVAKSHGAVVFVRFDDTDRGKAYALRFVLETDAVSLTFPC